MSGIKSAKKKLLITKIKNERGEIITSRKGIANVFGEFYKNYTTTVSKTNMNEKSEKVDNESSTDVHIKDTDEMTRIPEITTELQDAINKLKKR